MKPKTQFFSSIPGGPRHHHLFLCCLPRNFPTKFFRNCTNIFLNISALGFSAQIIFYCHRLKIPKKHDLKAVWRQPSKPPTIRNMESGSHFERLFQSPTQHVTGREQNLRGASNLNFPDSWPPSPRWSPHSGSFTRLLPSSGRSQWSFTIFKLCLINLGFCS